MYQPRTITNINPIPFAYDCSDCLVEVSIHTDIETDAEIKEPTYTTNETPISIKIIPQVVIPVHDCEVIYYEPNQIRNTRNVNRPINDDRLNLYRMCTTIICTFVIVLALSSILYHPVF